LLSLCKHRRLSKT